MQGLAGHVHTALRKDGGNKAVSDCVAPRRFKSAHIQCAGFVPERKPGQIRAIFGSDGSRTAGVRTRGNLGKNGETRAVGFCRGQSRAVGSQKGDGSTLAGGAV